MTTDELLFWDRWPRLVPLYGALVQRLADSYPDMGLKVSKSQISFYNRRLFAMVSPPVRRKKGWPEEFMMVSFGLSHPLDSPRIAMKVEAYPNRWTHHVLVENEEAIDQALLAWIDEAYRFSQTK